MIRRLIEKFVFWRYTKAALLWGDFESYRVSGFKNPDNPYFSRYTRWKKVYDRLGYKEISHYVWIDAGGYGHPYKHLLGIAKTN